MVLRNASLILLLFFSAPLLAVSQSEPVDNERYRAEFHWAVAVINAQHGGVCGGVLIAPRWVLTAAHCAGSPRYVLVDSAMRSVGKRVEVSRRINHPEFDQVTGQHDIALLYLAEHVGIAPAPVASSVDSLMLLRPGAAARIIGWGHSDLDRGAENRLRIAETQLDSLVRYRSLYRYQGYAGPCSSDSGSPMLMQTLDGRWLVVGVARAAKDMCSDRRGVGVYTDVGKAEAFILAHIANTEDQLSEQTE